MKEIIAGCDVSKDTVDVQIMFDDDAFEHLKIVNNQKGFERLEDEINKLSIKPKFVMESTGIYYEHLADYLTNQGYEVAVVNPLKVRKFGELNFSRTKTDKQDAKLLAQYGQTIKSQPYIVPTAIQYRIKRHISALRQLNKDLGAVKNRLQVAKDEMIALLLQEQQKLIERHIEQLTNQSDAAKTSGHIASIPSVGKLTAAVLSHYLHLYHFDNPNKFAAFAGLSPQKNQSGTSVRKPDKLSKYGNRTLKGSLYMSAIVCLRFGYFKTFVDRLRAKDKPTMVIICALMRKLLVIAWHLWHRQENYNPQRYQPA